MEERIQKIIAASGICSRRQAEEYILKGKVQVNGKTAKIGDKADISKDEIYLNNRKIEKTNKIYLMINKPKGYEVTTNPNVKKNILSLIPFSEKLFYVGRLDKNTTGLLIITNDGDFANKIAHPRYEKEKTYSVILDKKISEEDIKKIEHGINLKDGYIKGKIKKFSPTNIEITIHEGKKWIIKRLFFSLGYYVKELSRTRIGKLKLDVKIGKWRMLTKKEIEELIK